MDSPAKPTKLVELVLTAHQTMTYREVIEVPADATPDQLSSLAAARQLEVPASLYELADRMPTPSTASISEHRVRSTAEARIDSAARPQDPERPAGPLVRLPISSSSRALAISEGWHHDFGHMKGSTRWVLDITKESLKHAEIFQGEHWTPLSRADADDLEQSILDNIDREGLDAFGFHITSTPPRWSLPMPTDQAAPTKQSVIVLTVDHDAPPGHLSSLVKQIIDVGMADAVASANDPNVDNEDATIAASLKIEVSEEVDHLDLFALQSKLEALQQQLEQSGAMDGDSDRTSRLLYDMQANLATLLGQSDVAANWRECIARLNGEADVERPRA